MRGFGYRWVSAIGVPLVFLVTPPSFSQVTDTVLVSGQLFYGPDRVPAAGYTVGIVGGPSAWTDSLGHFGFRAVVGDSVDFWSQCRVERRSFGRSLGPFPMGRDELSAAEIEIDPSLCIEPEETRQYGIFSGRWTWGFEMSEWALCEALPDLSATAYGIGESWAWGSFSDGLVGPDMPDVEVSEDGYYTYFMKVRGTLIGPGGYGHMAVAPYLLYADSILELRPAKTGDCELSPGLRNRVAPSPNNRTPAPAA